MFISFSSQSMKNGLFRLQWMRTNNSATSLTLIKLILIKFKHLLHWCYQQRLKLNRFDENR